MQLAALASVDGKVLVNKGKGFVSARSGTPLNEGDRVISLNGSRAAVVYQDGCVTQLQENSLLALDKTAGCGKEAVKTGGQQPLRYAQAIGGSATDAGGGTAGGEGGAGGAGAGTGGAFAAIGGTTGLLVIGGVILGAAVISQANANNDNNPISGF
ncbi:MAG: hypothetical protein FJ170_03885 [Gammaproteobacteria bacterium]|nr:hypothetical protein [Gammaproteobacteria bacterium]